MEDLSIKVKRLRYARNLRLRVLENGEIVVTAPLRLPDRYIESFLAEHKDWIEEKRSVAVKKQENLTAERTSLFFHGKEVQFRVSVSNKKAGVKIENDQIIVTVPNEDHKTVRQVLEKWYRKEAEKRFKERVPLLADLVGRDVVRVTIRSQRTRWGSCSSRNTISLNWRLIMAPDVVSDYVIYHELAHLTHMNHSKRFWDLVEEYDPKYKESEKWLTSHHELLRF